MSDIFGLGSKYDSNGTPSKRDPLSTHDINGEKRNMYGQRVRLDSRMAGQIAGQQKGSLGANYQRQNLSNQMSDCFGNAHAEPQKENMTPSQKLGVSGRPPLYEDLPPRYINPNELNRGHQGLEQARIESAEQALP